ncbi:hypothetical protein [Luteimonas vadosa]|uniref:DUF3300 domain-containing protein n=1 Tax=Luteimonas vadosa TaxID=1165507 RepID=A0ABP9DTX5_9GAMM
MIRTLTLGLVAAVVLTGCVSSGYGYRSGVGDYYYGRSSAPYYGARVPYGGGGYGYPGGLYGSIGYGYPPYYGRGHYGYGLPYGSPYYRPGYGHYGPYYPPYHRYYVRPRHPDRHGGRRPDHVDPPGPEPGVDPDRDRDDIPWRNLNRLRDGLARDPQTVPSRPGVIVQGPTQGSIGGPPIRTAPPPRLERRMPQREFDAGSQRQSRPGGVPDEDRLTP